MVIVTEWCPPDLLERYLDPMPYRYDPALAYARPASHQFAGVEALVVRNRTPVGVAWLDAAPDLRVVGRLGSGLDNVDQAALQERGVRLVWAPGLNAGAVAEYVLGALVLAVRSLDDRFAATRTQWEREALGRELRGRRLVLVGLGHAGRAVASQATALGMRVFAHDPRLASTHPAWADAARVERLDDALTIADFLSLHVPATPLTKNLLNRTTLALLPPNAYVINTARGSLIDEAALLEALDAGRIAGATLDVRAAEPPPPDDPIRRHPRVRSTPHVAGLTEESQRRIAAHVLAEVRRILMAPRNLVGASTDDPSVLPHTI
jgi:(S)-sulfolactate dehydrogenase